MKHQFFNASFAAVAAVLTIVTPAFAIPSVTVAPKIQVDPSAQLIANSAAGVAVSMDSVGYCYRGVKRALKRCGYKLTGSEAYMAKEQLEDSGEFDVVSIKRIHIGDVLVHAASKRHPHGHIAVFLGDGLEASDHIGKLITGARYGGTTVFRVRSQDTDAATSAVDLAAADGDEVLPKLSPPSFDASISNDQSDAMTASSPVDSIAKSREEISEDLTSAFTQVVQLFTSAIGSFGA